MEILFYLFTGFVILSTTFMLFLQWLAQGSKDVFAKKLRITGWTGVALGYAAIALVLFAYSNAWY